MIELPLRLYLSTISSGAIFYMNFAMFVLGNVSMVEATMQKGRSSNVPSEPLAKPTITNDTI
jgi:hypothetical protein